MPAPEEVQHQWVSWLSEGGFRQATVKKILIKALYKVYRPGIDEPENIHDVVEAVMAGTAEGGPHYARLARVPELLAKNALAELGIRNPQRHVAYNRLVDRLLLIQIN